MKKSYLVTIALVGIAVAAGFGFFFFNLWDVGTRNVLSDVKPLSDEQMIKFADSLDETKAFKKKYPANQVYVDKASGYGVKYQAFPEKNESIDYQGEKLSPYVRLDVTFSRDGLGRANSIYCIPNYERTQKIYEQDWLKHYKVLPRENIVKYLENGGCFSNESDRVLESPTDLDLRSYLLTTDGKTYRIKYSLNNAELQQITKRIHENSILIKLDNATKGHLTILIPYDLINAKYDNKDYVLIVLVDAEETNYTEVKNQFERTVTIDFDEGTTRIEIIGAKLI